MNNIDDIKKFAEQFGKDFSKKPIREQFLSMTEDQRRDFINGAKDRVAEAITQATEWAKDNQSEFMFKAIGSGLMPVQFFMALTFMEEFIKIVLLETKEENQTPEALDAIQDIVRGYVRKAMGK